MSKLYTGILTNMKRIKEHYKELLELSIRKTDIIMDKRVSDLEKLVALEENLILKLGELESERQGFLAVLGKIKGFDPDSISLSHLVDWAQGDVKNELQSLQIEFDGILQKQGHLNEVNSKLLETNLEYIDFALLLMTGEGDGGKLYEKKGQVSKGSQSRNLFDTQA